ncbi:uncharacterized protein LOC105200396 isoform X2 [Solenopsis invicta]|uniref:uncharacterized protein LOC105200396 isoform X2 n=1 Tax=Solenopsis invicta TaxID=13686 RepID=UPI000595904D|nr:uncharacterized protein LOC105200396 isoform X2 [Solenopsis invicta]
MNVTLMNHTSAWCSSDRILTRKARTLDSSSFFAWPQTLFSNRPDVSIVPKLWPSRSQLQEWTRKGIVSLLRLASLVNPGNKPMHIEFRPEDGPRAAKAFQQHFGYRGEWLIEQLGNGLDPHIRLNRQQVPRMFSMSPQIPFRRDNNVIRNSANAFEYNRYNYGSLS